MKATRTITLRIPYGWSGRFSSEDVRGMLAEFLQHPTQLAYDPGPGDARLSLSLPARAVQVVSGLLNDTESGALRRLIAAHARELPPTRIAPRLLLPASTRPSPRVVTPLSLPSPSAASLRIAPRDFSAMRGASLEPHLYDAVSSARATSDEALSSSPAELVSWWQDPWFWCWVVGPIVLLGLFLWYARKFEKALAQAPAAAPAPPSFVSWNPVTR